MVINEFIHENKFPESCKLANIIPIPKKGPETDPTNYRPIAVTCALAKIIERLLLNQINSYLSENEILCPTQFGFRAKFSTHDVLLYATEKWRLDANANKSVHVAFLDLSKAFNSINLSILDNKLKTFGETKAHANFY